VEDLVRAAGAAGVRDERVLDAVRTVPRAAFVPADRVEEAYRDVPVPIPHGQVTTQPSLVVRIVEAARVGASDRARGGRWLWVAKGAARAPRRVGV
jgi:protein-L-isoaspartate(D-aspartate) O-methyltransferase